MWKEQPVTEQLWFELFQQAEESPVTIEDEKTDDLKVETIINSYFNGEELTLSGF